MQGTSTSNSCLRGTAENALWVLHHSHESLRLRDKIKLIQTYIPKSVKDCPERQGRIAIKKKDNLKMDERLLIELTEIIFFSRRRQALLSPLFFR